MKNATSITERYPRTLYVWLGSEDKALKKAIADGETVQAFADRIQREPVSVVRRLSELDLFSFEVFTEEWAEIMSLCLCGVPMDTALDWCNVADDRLPIEMIEAMSDRTLRAEMDLALKHRLIVANSDAIDDLVWLQAQPIATREGYDEACMKLVAAFDVLTPTTLKAVVQGAAAPMPARIPGAPAHQTTARSRRRTTRSYGATRTVRAGSSAASKKYRRSRKKSYWS